MKPLPPTRYEYAEWLKAKVGIDYHAQADWHYYSVPHALVGEHVMVRVTAQLICRQLVTPPSRCRRSMSLILSIASLGCATPRSFCKKDAG